MLVQVSATALHDVLNNLLFLNSGVTSSSDGFHWEYIEAVGDGQKLIYLEADNVSCTECVWSDDGIYYAPHPYLFKDRPNGTEAPTSPYADAPAPKPGVYEGDAPASGMRSAVPLGGISAGTVELRGDGTLHEWTIHNAGPHGAAKIQEYLDAHFAISVGNESRILQTHPHRSSSVGGRAGTAPLTGVTSMRYQGSHPVSRLDVLPTGTEAALLKTEAVNLDVSLYAYSAFKIDDMNTSARPAVAFTLAVNSTANATNTGTGSATKVSFMFQLPFLVESDQIREGTPLPTQPNASIDTPAKCSLTCMRTGGCASWVFNGVNCILQGDAPLNKYKQGVSSGLTGYWEVDQEGQCLTLVRPGNGPMHGNVSLCGSSEGGQSSSWKFSTDNDPTSSFASLATESTAEDDLVVKAGNGTAYTALGNADWNDIGHVIVDGTKTHFDTLEECEALCTTTPLCTTGLFLNGTVRHGECWLASVKAVSPRHDFCGFKPGQACAAFEKVPGPTPPPPPPPPLPPVGLRGVYGTVSVSAVVVTGTNMTLSLTMGWNMPHRDQFNYQAQSSALFKPFGNHYSTLYKDSVEAAWGRTRPSDRAKGLVSTVEDIWAFHRPFMTSTLPTYLPDMLVNSLSHTRDSMWWESCPGCHVSQDPRVNGTAGKGFWRQYEAYDCPDIDSIHNDGERHIPYIMFFPDGTRSKLGAWAGNQQPNGMLAEQILNKNPDSPQGQIMSDSSSMFIIYVLELLRWNGDTETAKLYYPTVKRAATWQLAMSAQFNVPYKLETTYDILKFPDYQLSTYASAFHIAALKAAQELALHAGDGAFAAECGKGISAAQEAMDTLQWNATDQFYNAGSSNCTAGKGCTEPEGVFADAFYAQVLAYSLWGQEVGALLKDPSRLDSHLKKTLEANCMHTDVQGKQNLVPGCPNGLIIMTNRKTQLTDQQVWEMATHDHSSLTIQRAKVGDTNAVAAALNLSEATATSYSRRLNDQWNVAGIKSNDGYPSITSHYGYHMTSWHIPLAVSGQLASMLEGNRSLSFAPKFACDAEASGYRLPVFLPGMIGILSCEKLEITLEMTAGTPLLLDNLAVDHASYPRLPVTFSTSNVLKWSLR